MTRMAKKQRVVTQIGTQIHSYSECRSAVAAIRSGAIGKVSEAHLWIDTSWSGPPKKRPDREDSVPANLDWKLWLGVAPRRRQVFDALLVFGPAHRGGALGRDSEQLQGRDAAMGRPSLALFELDRSDRARAAEVRSRPWNQGSLRALSFVVYSPKPFDRRAVA